MTFIDYGKHITSNTPVGKIAGGTAVAAFTHGPTRQNYTIFVNFTGKQAYLDVTSDSIENKVNRISVKRTDLLGNLLNKNPLFQEAI